MMQVHKMAHRKHAKNQEILAQNRGVRTNGTKAKEQAFLCCLGWDPPSNPSDSSVVLQF